MKKSVTMFAAIMLMLVAAANIASASDSWSFVMLGDTRGDNNTYTGINSNLNAMAIMIKSLQPDLVIVAGDLCNGDALNPSSHWYPPDGNFTNNAMKTNYAFFFANWKAAMQPVFDYSTSNGIPIYTVRGNHENEDGENAPIPVLKDAYKEAFSRYVPDNGTNEEKGFSWSLTYKNVTFVAADQYFNFDPWYATNTPWSGYHYLNQSWVTQQLAQSTSPYKFFIAHEPMFQTEGNGYGEEENEDAQHFFGTNSIAIQTRSNFWNAIGDAGAQFFLCGHLHLETVATTTNGHGRTIIQLTAGNGGAPPQDYIPASEPGVTTL